MGNLKGNGVTNRFGATPRRFGPLPEMQEKVYDARRSQAHPWRAWYKTARWQRLREDVLKRDGFTCQRADCGVMHRKMICNHKRPHRGDEALFWDPLNLEAVCQPCHDGPIQREESASRPSLAHQRR